VVAMVDLISFINSGAISYISHAICMIFYSWA
jgi:hypothetical protein